MEGRYVSKTALEASEEEFLHFVTAKGLAIRVTGGTMRHCHTMQERLNLLNILDGMGVPLDTHVEYPVLTDEENIQCPE